MNRKSVMMQKKMRAVFVLLVSLLLATGLLSGLGGCSSATVNNDSAVAATVNGTNILESEVTESIASIRTSYGYDSDEDWATFMTTSGYTAESFREEIIDYLAQNILVQQTCEEAGIVIDSAEIDDKIAEIRSTYGYEDDATWTATLEGAGYTEEDYRSETEHSLLTERLLATMVPTTEPTAEDIQTYANSYAATTYAGKKSSHILFNSDDQATAQTVLATLQASDDLAVDFAAAASEYSTDTASAIDGGNVGWDCLASFVTEYSEALDALEAGQMSEIVESDYGYHIILCTGSYAPTEGETVDLTTMPAEIYEQITADTANEATYNAQRAYLDALVAAAEIVINPMP